jgi:hypothetical protein
MSDTIWKPAKKQIGLVVKSNQCWEHLGGSREQIGLSMSTREEITKALSAEKSMGEPSAWARLKATSTKIHWRPKTKIEIKRGEQQ